MALLSRVHEQKRAAGDHDAMDALAAYYADPAYWSKILRVAFEPAEA